MNAIKHILQCEDCSSGKPCHLFDEIKKHQQIIKGRYKVKVHGVAGHERSCGKHLALLLSTYKDAGAWAVSDNQADQEAIDG